MHRGTGTYLGRADEDNVGRWLGAQGFVGTWKSCLGAGAVGRGSFAACRAGWAAVNILVLASWVLESQKGPDPDTR